MKEKVQISAVRTDELPPAIARKAAKAPDGIAADRGRLYCPAGGYTLVLDDTEDARAVLRAVRGAEKRDPDAELRAFLETGETAGAPEGFRGLIYCVSLFVSDRTPDTDLLNVIRDLVPTEEGDLLIAMKADTVALIRGGMEAEAEEFALALIDTVDSETGYRLTAGIGGERTDPAGMHESYQEACEAIRTGRRFSPDRTVFLYGRQTLERLLDSIPPETRREFRRTVFGERAEKSLSEETLATAEAFLRSDLNLSDTARQMYIHRNTLTYRLDKLQKETSLDLRKFDDAVLFRLLTMMPGDERDTPKER